MSEYKKNTAVDWLVNELTYKSKNGELWISFDSCADISEYANRAKEMEKEQLLQAYTFGTFNGIENMIGFESKNESSEEYYNKTFKREEDEKI
jgi:hypothetical protein